MKKRLMTSLIILAVLALAFVLKAYVSSYFFDVLLVVVATFGAFEMSKLLSKTGHYNNHYILASFPAVMLIILLIGAAFDSSLTLSITITLSIFAMILLAVITYVWAIIFNRKTAKEMKVRGLQNSLTINKFAFNKALNTLIGMIYPSFLFMFMVILNHFDDFTTSFKNIGSYGGYFSIIALIFAFLIPVFTDTFAYLTGLLFKGKKLAPKISPNKHVSGCVGGLLWTVLLSSCVYLILNAIPLFYEIFTRTGFAIWQVVIISFLGSIISQMGDLFESYIKRKAGVKDSGTILPGHGGMLDRCDSYFFVAPFLVLSFAILLLV